MSRIKWFYYLLVRREKLKIQIKLFSKMGPVVSCFSIEIDDMVITDNITKQMYKKENGFVCLVLRFFNDNDYCKCYNISFAICFILIFIPTNFQFFRELI